MKTAFFQPDIPTQPNDHKILGNVYDFMLLLHAKDMESYHAFTRRVLTGEFHVRTYKSLFVMNFTKADSGIIL